MAKSPEYPDLTWVEPRSWTDANRTSVQLIVIHDTEGSSHAQSAEDGAAYDARRTDGTSTHYFVDNTSVVQCVRTSDRAHTARAQGNRRGIQYELCAKASWSRGSWLNPNYGLPMLRRAAHQAARDCRKWNIPARKLSPDQVADGVKGFCGHADITKAFPQDGGTHTDPGKNFPWDVFIDLVQDELKPEAPVATQFNADDKAELKAGATAGVLGYTGGGLPGDLPAGSNFLAYFREGYNRDKAQDADVDQNLALLGAYCVALMSDMAALVQDPADMDNPELHPIVRAVRYALDNPAPSA